MNWQPVTIALAALTPWERNPKRISRSHAKRLLDLWDKLGQFQTIAIGPGGEVYDGHQRLSVLLAAYGKDYQVQALQAPRALTEEERQELTIAAHVGTVGQFDWDALAGWDAGALQGWGLDGETLGNWRADVGALDAMLAAEKEAPEDVGPQIDRAEELRVKWGVESGQVWVLGEHVVVCGDCTDRGVVERVMGGEKAHIVFTDPPYNVASEGRNYAADAPTQKKTYEALKNADWDKDFDITSVFPVLESVMAEDCAVYLCTSQWLVQRVWEWMWSWSKFCSYNVWCKPNPAPSLAKRHWTWATELIPYAVRGRHVANFPNEGHALNWWEIVSPSHTTDHPTEKPIHIPARAISFSSNPGAIVFDPFLGSGTTLIACERLGRRCRGIEISPAYVGVTLERWATMTGKTPTLLDS